MTVSVSIPFGMIPSRMIGGSPFNGSMNRYDVSNSCANSYFLGDPVRLLAGKVLPVGVSGNNSMLGVFAGCEYIDPTTKRPTWSVYLPAGTSSAGRSADGNRTNPIVYVIDDPDVVYRVMADASVTSGDVGMNFHVTISAGNTQTGISRAVLKAASRTSAVEMVRVIGKFNVPNNDFSDDNTADDKPIVEVVIAGHQWRKGIVSAA